MDNKFWQAIDVINKPQKWTKRGDLNNDHGRRCMLGALLKAEELEEDLTIGIMDHFRKDPDIPILVKAIQEQDPERYAGSDPWMIADFNDDDKTKHADVIRVLEKAAIQLDERV